ncbi:hypothetical protein [Salegentibacter chungangensis]|uniref:CHRD domain-containing protein n=1 Tax=Salegentibacter chungangensis TaxID=1335724 RepID=A0ABW3NV67_9FLAO
MKKLKKSLSALVIATMLFTSCSKDETSIAEEPVSDQVAVLTLGPVLNDVLNRNALRQQSVPDCSEAAPAHAQISFVYGDSNTPVDIVVDILSDENGLFTAYDEALEIPVASGETTVSVSLTDFVVWDDDNGSPGNVIWVAPKEGSEYAQFVDEPLDKTWELRAGTKTYTDVEVICFDNRDANLYGYQFFTITPVPLIEFCMFGNYCPPSGRHYPASYSVSVWEYADGEVGDQIYEDLVSELQMENGEYYADPLCFALPDREGQDEYYVEIFLLDAEGQYDGPDRVILSGVITDDEIKTFYNGDNLDYYHFQFGCGDDGPPPFNDPTVEAKHYKACIKSLDDTYAVGFAYLMLKGTELKTTVLAANLEANKMHPQHIHQNASCDDYGGVFWPLELEGGGFPTADADGILTYQRTFALTAQQAANANFADRTVVLHGKTVNGNYEAGQPVACGEFSILTY